MNSIKKLSKVLLLLSLVSLIAHLYISFFSTSSCSWNTGVMLGSIDSLRPIVLIFLMLVALIVTSYLFRNSHPQFWEILLVLIISSLGNIVDRAFHGAVCDYIDVGIIFQFPIFNLNDIFISLSLAFILFIVFHESLYSKKRRE